MFAVRSAVCAAQRSSTATVRATTTRRLMADAAATRPLLTLNFLTPEKPIYHEKKVDMITVPGTDGEEGVLALHVPMLIQLKPGLVVVHEEKDSKAPEHFFVSGGWALVTNDSTCTVSAPEAVPLEQLDPSAIAAGLKAADDEIAKAASEEDKNKGLLVREVYAAMQSSLQRVATK